MQSSKRARLREEIARYQLQIDKLQDKIMYLYDLMETVMFDFISELEIVPEIEAECIDSEDEDI